MINVLVGLGGGLYAQRVANSIHLPEFSRAVDETEQFKLIVRVLSATVPSLAEPGLLTSEKPRIEVGLGGTKKVTELGDFRAESSRGPSRNNSNREDSDDSSSDDGSAKKNRWHFGEELTFVASRADILGNGVQLILKSQTDWKVGWIQVRMNGREREDSFAQVDLRKDILPACARKDPGAAGDAPAAGPFTELRPPLWETPVLDLELKNLVAMGDGVGGRHALGESAGRVSVTFGVNTDPELLLQAAELAELPLVDRMANPFIQGLDWGARAAGSAASAAQAIITEPVKIISAATEASGCYADRGHRLAGTPPQRRTVEAGLCGPSLFDCNEDGSGCRLASGTRISARARRVDAGSLSPDQDPEQWVSYKSPQGRTFWHHTGLGPPPWRPREHSFGETQLRVGLQKAEADVATPLAAKLEQARDADPSLRSSQLGLPWKAHGRSSPPGSSLEPVPEPGPQGGVPAPPRQAAPAPQPQPQPQMPPQMQPQQQVVYVVPAPHGMPRGPGSFLETGGVPARGLPPSRGSFLETGGLPRARQSFYEAPRAAPGGLPMRQSFMERQEQHGYPATARPGSVVVVPQPVGPATHR